MDIKLLNKKISSPELIDILADLGYGKHYKHSGDTRTASFVETGTFTGSDKTYAKIVVKVNNNELFDYGARIWIK